MNSMEAPDGSAELDYEWDVECDSPPAEDMGIEHKKQMHAYACLNSIKHVNMCTHIVRFTQDEGDSDGVTLPTAVGRSQKQRPRARRSSQ